MSVLKFVRAFFSLLVFYASDLLLLRFSFFIHKSIIIGFMYSFFSFNFIYVGRVNVSVDEFCKKIDEIHLFSKIQNEQTIWILYGYNTSCKRRQVNIQQPTTQKRKHYREKEREQMRRDREKSKMKTTTATTKKKLKKQMHKEYSNYNNKCWNNIWTKQKCRSSATKSIIWCFWFYYTYAYQKKGKKAEHTQQTHVHFFTSRETSYQCDVKKKCRFRVCRAHNSIWWMIQPQTIIAVWQNTYI